MIQLELVITIHLIMGVVSYGVMVLAIGIEIDKDLDGDINPGLAHVALTLTLCLLFGVCALIYSVTRLTKAVNK